MARSDAPFGFKPIGNMAGGPYNGPLLECVVLGGVTTDVNVGDLVNFVGNGSVAGTTGATRNGIPSVEVATAGDADNILGSVVNFAPDFQDLASNYAEGDVARDRICFVAPAVGSTLYIAQDNGTSGVLTVADIGSAIDHAVPGVPSTNYGISNHVLDANSTSNSGAGSFRIVGLWSDPENEDINTGTTAGTVWVVQMMERQTGTSQLATGSGG
jgi:hypothetical protein